MHPEREFRGVYMDIFFILAFIALLATIGVLVLGIRSMIHGGEEDVRASTRLMFRRIEFQAAAVTMILAGILFAAGWPGMTSPGSDRLDVNLGVMPAEVLLERYDPDSAEVKAYGGIPDTADAHLVTLVLKDRGSGRRIENASVTASLGQLGLSRRTKELRPASFSGVTTYGSYFRMSKAGLYRIEISVSRPNVSGRDRVQLDFHRP